MTKKNKNCLAVVIRLLDKAQRERFWLTYDKLYIPILFTTLGLYFLLFIPEIDVANY